MNHLKVMSILSFVLLVICVGSYTYSQTTIHLSVNQPPSLVADAGVDTFVWLGDSVEIGGTPTAQDGTLPYTYSWSPTEGLSNPAVANPIAFPDTTTTYTLTLTDGNGCKSISTMKVKVSNTGISEGSSLVNMKIFPNPNNGNFKILLNGNYRGELTIALMNNIGQVIYNEIIEKTGRKLESQVELSHHPEGVYMLRLNGENVNLIQRLLIH